MRLNFFETFWAWVKRRLDQANDYEETEHIPQKIQPWYDIYNYNPLAIVNDKITAKVCDEATFDIETTSTLAEPLQGLIKDLEAKRYDICGMMNGIGGCFVTMAETETGEPYHVIVPQTDVSIYSIANNKITEIAMIIDKKRYKKQWYNLVRHHILDENGTLSIYYYITNESGEEKSLDEWEHFKDLSKAYINANHIGVGYFKSQKSSRGLSPVLGVPLNFGCENEERQIMRDRQALIKEMKHAEMKLFADKSIARMEKSQGHNEYGIPEDIYLIQKKAGIDGTLIDSFAPATRFSDYEAKLEKSYEDYERQIGLNKGFLSNAEATGSATATEIKTANIQTVSFIKRIQSEMSRAVEETIKADGAFLNVSEELYTLKIDWFDIYEDYNEQYNRIAQAVKDGAAEKIDQMKWLFPDLSIEELNEKLERITAEKQQNLIDFNLANVNGDGADIQGEDTNAETQSAQQSQGAAPDDDTAADDTKKSAKPPLDKKEKQ